jgi:hypothetical protein
MLFIINLALISLFLPENVWAQIRKLPKFKQDSLQVSPRKQLPTSKTDSSSAQGAQTDTLARRKSDVETTVKYTAKDSIVLNVDGSIARLYGEAKITYGDIDLEADYIEINWESGIIDAQGRKDSTGKMIGNPVFKEGSQTFQTDNIRYNIKSKKSSIKGVVTQYGEGYIHGNQVFKDPENNLYIRHAMYTTCNLAHPHFFINSSKIKLVENKQVVTGPFNLVINDIPTPLGFAFGMFPYSKTRKSGIIMPVYGEEPRDRGFYLRDGGYYWAISDYINMTFRGEIYTRGGWGLNIGSQYIKKYAYTGNFNLRYNRRKSGDEGFQSLMQDFWITWAHSPFSKGTGRFSANVNAGTSTFNARNAYESLQRRISPTFNSNISYSNVIRGLPISYAFSARHDMNTQTGIMNMTLPDMSVNVTRLYPFKRKSSAGGKWWETIGFSYSFQASNRLSNSPKATTSFSGIPRVSDKSDFGKSDTVAFSLNNLDRILRMAEIGARHSIPVSMSLKVLKFFSLNPSFQYQETWYPQRYNFTTQFPATEFPQGDSAAAEVLVQSQRGFYRSYSYSGGVSLTTNIYGTFQIQKKRLEAIRHRLVPNIGFNYQPDFSDPKRFSFYQEVYTGPIVTNRQANNAINSLADNAVNNQYNNAINNSRTRISRFQNSVYGAPGVGESGSISFSLSNTLEAKIRSKNDTAKNKFEKISLLDQFNISSSYNLAADSFNLAPISISARTRLFNNIDINFSTSLDPYAGAVLYTDENGERRQQRLNYYAWNRPSRDAIAARYTGETVFQELTPQKIGKVATIEQLTPKGIGRITYANLSVSTNINPKAREKQKERLSPENNPTQPAEQMKQIQANPDQYVDFEIPWSLNVSYNLNYSKQGFDASQVAQTLSFNGDLSLTPKWKFTFSSGYDFESKGIINTTNIGIVRDLHCWDMTFNWTPFGTWQSYSFDLKVRSSILQDLKLSRRRGFAAGAYGGLN